MSTVCFGSGSQVVDGTNDGVRGFKYKEQGLKEACYRSEHRCILRRYIGCRCEIASVIRPEVELGDGVGAVNLTLKERCRGGG